mmetsp:Transcript_25014/g.71951  ORF Transcript_25014/g.71951 Transcript_25014/m.71951 type:complete len:235 (-) Transcript_25014:69-773(-)
MPRKQPHASGCPRPLANPMRTRMARPLLTWTWPASLRARRRARRRASRRTWPASRRRVPASRRMAWMSSTRCLRRCRWATWAPQRSPTRCPHGPARHVAASTAAAARVPMSRRLRRRPDGGAAHARRPGPSSRTRPPTYSRPRLPRESSRLTPSTPTLRTGPPTCITPTWSCRLPQSTSTTTSRRRLRRGGTAGHAAACTTAAGRACTSRHRPWSRGRGAARGRRARTLRTRRP